VAFDEVGLIEMIEERTRQTETIGVLGLKKIMTLRKRFG